MTSREEIEALLERESFRYQRIELPHGLRTPGKDRSPTARAIFPDDMSGASVLDIGCYYGYFLYEALKRGASRVKGLEIDPERLRQARLLADVNAAPLELSDEDFHDVCRTERFDYVLMLNLIHHLEDPIGGIRAAAGGATRALVIEFPTPADPKFGRTLWPGLGKFVSRFPVIGVSTDRKHKFLFSRSAVERVLGSLDIPPEQIDIDVSPHHRGGRLIAIAHLAGTP